MVFDLNSNIMSIFCFNDTQLLMNKLKELKNTTKSSIITIRFDIKRDNDIKSFNKFHNLIEEFNDKQVNSSIYFTDCEITLRKSEYTINSLDKNTQRVVEIDKFIDAIHGSYDFELVVSKKVFVETNSGRFQINKFGKKPKSIYEIVISCNDMR